MFTNFKNIIIVALAVLLVGCFVWARYEQAQSDKNANIAINAQKNVQVVTKLVKEYIDSTGVKHGIYQDNKPVSQGDFLAVKKSYIDSLGEGFRRALEQNKIKDNQIIELSRTNVILAANGLKGNKTIDSLGRVVYRYKDKTFDLAFTPFKDSDNTNVFDASANIDLNYVKYSKRNPPIIGTKKTYTDIFSSDPRVSIAGQDKVTIEQERPFLGLRAQAITSYNFATGGVSMGPGLQIDLGKLSLSSGYLYNFKDKQWKPSATARYEIFGL